MKLFIDTANVEDIGEDAMALLQDVVDVFMIHDIDTEIIAASIRNPYHVLLAAKAGAHIATIPYNIIEKMTHHKLTDEGIEKFLKDWEKAVK